MPVAGSLTRVSGARSSVPRSARFSASVTLCCCRRKPRQTYTAAATTMAISISRAMVLPSQTETAPRQALLYERDQPVGETDRHAVAAIKAEAATPDTALGRDHAEADA